MPEIGPQEFAIPFFAEQAFTRRKCVSCGSDFWSQNPNQETCGEAPCAPYSFLGNPPTKKRYSLPEMRIQFMDYFAQRGHTRIPPYPIVARWRDDVYLVGASIYDFQPYVTEGSMPPPANPLVISQPCIRFTDVELVGPTGGRHMTIFEMGGAHAFNYPDKELYWKDQCVRYHHDLLTSVLGVPSESVTYKEHFWSGGGNAGPDLETIVAGLEIATLVFMQYRVQGEQLIPLPIRTVDTGYGMERWSWLSQGSPSGFQAIQAPVLQQVMDLAKISVEPSIMQAFTLASSVHGWSNIAKNRDAYAQTVASQTGVNVDELRKIQTSLEAVYAITDHTKAATFLLAEGVVPSNVGEGYLARLIIRRAGRMARQLGIYQDLASIVEGQVKFWGSDFRSLREMRSEILEGFDAELKKYQETISRGTDIVFRLSKDLAKKGVEQISTDQLVQLYDSQGLSPEIVKEGAEKAGVTVTIPDNFLTLVAQSHSRPSEEKTESQLQRDIEEKLRDLPPTRTLYYENPYKTSFKAKLVARVAGDAVVLDQTIFYPQGGGQIADHGTIWFGEKKIPVIDVQKYGDRIVHFLAEPIENGTDIVKGEIDWQRRQNLMRHHTGTHVLIGAARRVLGDHVWQAGAQKEVDSSRLDITHYREITRKERERIERLANQTILKDLPVSINWMAREKAEAKYGFRLYQGGAVPGSKIRVVRIAGWDAEACGGTHVKRTGELGVFRIEKIDRLQDGIERIIFSAGEPALKRISENSQELTATADLLKTTPDQLPDTVKALVSERDSLEKELEKIQAKNLETRLRHLEKTAKTVGPVRLVIEKTSKRRGSDPVNIANRLKESDPRMVAIVVEVSDRIQIVVAAGDDAVKAGINAGDIVSTAARILGGGGGGRQFFATGGGPAKEKTEDALKAAEETVNKQLGQSAAKEVA
ncbi:MAG TPA: alanine--tRNA ligase [Candidatus Bathyarchaeia archaeon]|nr:alanine--tRNA ligase [Candidatus Bathyarchaeia archaeon]